MQLQFNLTQESTQEIEPGYCQCGCGQKTSLATRTRPERGMIKGRPMRFISGHNGRINRISLETKFWARVEKADEKDCWLWTGAALPAGYGTFSSKYTRRTYYAHRFSFELHHGPIPDGLWVLHRCDRPRCCNPAHLFLGTQQDNMADMAAKGRGAGTILTAGQVREIRAHRNSGLKYKDIAKLYGVSAATICTIVRRYSWKHI